MAKGKRDGLLIAGGGLAGSLAALAMARARPDVPLLLVEEGESFGGDHILPFLDEDVDPADRWLADPLASLRWPGFYTVFPGQSRKLKVPCGAIRPESLDHQVRETLRPEHYRLGTKIVAVRDNELILQGGETVRADGAIDARGPANLSMLDLGWETVVGRDCRLAAPHGLDRPVLLDATVDQASGTRFMRCLPLSEDRMRIEEVRLSEFPAPDAGDAVVRIEAYAAMRGWSIVEGGCAVAGSHPLARGGDFAAFWRVGGARVAKLGLRGGFFHPGTGLALPDALRMATVLTEQGDLTGAALHDRFEAEAAALWRKREVYRGFNERLFAAAPADRVALLKRFHALDPGLLARFHAGRMTMLDRRRIARPL